MKTPLLYLFSILCLLSNSLVAQHAVSFKPIIYGYHPFEDPSNEIAPRKEGLAGTFALEPGIIVGYENYMMHKNFGIKANFSVRSDNAYKLSGFAHLGLRCRTFTRSQSLAISIGPTFFMRQSWEGVPGYISDGAWNSGDEFQTKFAILGGEIEYIYYVTESHRLTASVNHISPMTYSFSLGYSYWIPKIKKNKRRYRKRSRNYRR